MTVALALAALGACRDTFAPGGAIGPPDSVVATPLGMRQVSVRWSTASGAIGYLVERRANVTGPFVAVRDLSTAFTTSFADDGLDPGTTYGYRVRARSAGGALSAPSLVAGARTAPWPGIRVSTSIATPEQTDADGFTVLLTHGVDTLRAPLLSADQRVFSPLSVGTYEVALQGVAANCRVAPDSSVATTVTDQGLSTVADVSFIVRCVDPTTGELQVSVATAGDSLDADGYTLTLSGLADDASLPDSQRAYFRRDAIGVQYSRLYDHLRPGDYTLSLDGLAGNCAVAGSATRDFRIEREAETPLAVNVTCQALDDPNRPLVWSSRWSSATAPAGQRVALTIGLDLSRRAGQDVAAVQASFTYDPAVLRLDSAAAQGPWQATFNTGSPAVTHWLAFVNGTGPTDSTVFARFVFTVVGAAGASTTTTTSIDAATDGQEQDLLPLIRREEGTFTVAAGAANQPPVARPGGPYAATAGQSVTLDGGASSDPDGTITAFAWTFGDGSSGSGATASHVYVTAGTYTATLTVTDNLGATAGAAATVNVAPAGGANQPPVAVANGPYSGTPGAPVTFSAAGSSDPDGSITAYQWTFGDGATATGSAATHSYSVGGSYPVSLTVTDNLGATGVATTSAVISGGSTRPLIWASAFGAASAPDSLVTLTITLDLSTDLPQTPGVEALQSWAVDSLKWDPTVLRYFAFNFGPGGAGSVNPTDALSHGKLLFNGVQPAANSTGLVTIATITFKVIGAPGSRTTTATALGVLLGTPATGAFSYGPYVTVSEGTVIIP